MINKFLKFYIPICLSVLIVLGMVLTTPKAYAAITIDKTTSASSSDSNDITTGALDTTGDTLFVIVESCYISGTNCSINTVPIDSNGNTWHMAVNSQQNGGGASYGTIFYAYDKSGSPLVTGSGNTFSTNSSNSSYPSMEVLTFKGTLTTGNPLDQTNNSAVGTGSVSTVQPGSITPSVNNEVIVSSLTSFDTSLNVSIDSGMTITGQIPGVGGQHFSSAAAYIVQTTAGAINPTWTNAQTVTSLAAGIASFKAGAATSTPLAPMVKIQNTAVIIKNDSVIIKGQ